MTPSEDDRSFAHALSMLASTENQISNNGDEVRRGKRAHGLRITAAGRNHCKYEASTCRRRCRLAFAPYGREPGLLVTRKSRRAVVVSHLEESGSSDIIAPGVEIEEAAIAATAKAFLVVSSWV